MIAPEDLATMQIDEAIHKIDEAIQSGIRPYVYVRVVYRRVQVEVYEAPQEGLLTLTRCEYTDMTDYFKAIIDEAYTICAAVQLTVMAYVIGVHERYTLDQIKIWLPSVVKAKAEYCGTRIRVNRGCDEAAKCQITQYTDHEQFKIVYWEGYNPGYHVVGHIAILPRGQSIPPEDRPKGYRELDTDLTYNLYYALIDKEKMLKYLVAAYTTSPAYIDRLASTIKRGYIHTLDNLDVVKAWVRELEPYVEKIELV